MTYLDEILIRKKSEVQELLSARRDRHEAPAVRAPKSLRAALLKSSGVSVIGEIKRASPSQGTIRAGLDIADRAQAYESAGVAGISVLTDGPGFGGSFDDLKTVRACVDVPLLCKDFIVHEAQIETAHESGADAVLLIVAALSDTRLGELLTCAKSLGMDALVETHDEADLERAMAVGADLIGVNNRDLRSFEVDLTTTARLLPKLPPGIVGVAESGVRDLASATFLANAGARALLIGEALVRADDPRALVKSIHEIAR